MKFFDFVIQRFFLGTSLTLCTFFASCGGSGGGAASDATVSFPNSPYAMGPSVSGSVLLKAPSLSFSDTGVSISDGITRNGLWAVMSDFSWEYSLDQGATWTNGIGGAFEVRGDGSKMIWVRARDDAGNKSEIVVVSCVLDTKPPASVTVTADVDGFTRKLQITGLEAGARWEYSLDNQLSWISGSGSSLGTLGNGLKAIWLRQVDIAGNVSVPQMFDFQVSGSEMNHEASTNPLQPSILAKGFQTMLIHGVVARGDADYVRWDIPKNHLITSVKLVRYVSDDLIAFYAIQPNSVFDAGVDVNRMLVYGHMGPLDLNRNVLSSITSDKLGEGSMTLWFQQTGLLPTEYAIEVTLQPIN